MLYESGIQAPHCYEVEITLVQHRHASSTREQTLRNKSLQIHSRCLKKAVRIPRQALSDPANSNQKYTSLALFVPSLLPDLLFTEIILFALRSLWPSKKSSAFPQKSRRGVFRRAASCQTH